MRKLLLVYICGMKPGMYRPLNLKPMKDRSVLNYHPWIFSGAIQTPVKNFDEGETVEVFDCAGKYLATGHFHHGTIMVRVISFVEREINVDFWIEKITAAYNSRNALALSNTNTYRLIHGEGDSLPGLIIDIYNSAAVIQCHSAGMMLNIQTISEALQRISGLSPDTIYNKSAEASFRQTDVEMNNGLMKGNQLSGTVEEYGHLFHVNWEEGQKTGFFLDQRENRQLLAHYAKGKKILNTFSYSGGFSIYGLKAGAAHVDSVDSSKKAAEWMEKNIELNFPGGANHEFHTIDVFDFLKARAEQYDIIVLDPPAFAKHLSAVDKAVIGYRNLNAEAISRIKPGGLIFTFSCSQAIDRQLFRKTVFTAAAKTRRNVKILHQLSQGPDHPVSLYHPEGEYLKGLVLQVDEMR